MSILVTTAREAPRLGLRSVRVYVGLYGLVYDTLHGLWADPARFYDQVERRGLKLEKELNTRIEQIEREVGVSVGSLRRGLQLRLRRMQREVIHSTHAAEDELEKQVERTLDRLGIPSRDRLERLSAEIEALSAKIDEELSLMAEREKALA